MWPFTKKQNLPGFKKDNQGNLIFELTEEEKREVQKFFNMFKKLFSEFVIKKEAADEIQKGMMAQGLFYYAQDQIMLSGFASNKSEKKKFINKAIASISKAYSLYPLPIYMYDLACFMEMIGANDEAKNALKSFLELQENFKPSRIQEILLNAQSRDIDEAIKDAETKI
jgi:tetratricopeptide (TPR) repeat protein